MNYIPTILFIGLLLAVLYSRQRPSSNTQPTIIMWCARERRGSSIADLVKTDL